MNKKLKCVIVGYGYMGEIRKQVIENNELLKLVGICDPDAKKLKRIKDVQTSSSFDDLLITDPDIVFVCTPNRSSPDICVKSMDLGKHVFCGNVPRNAIDE